MLLSQLPTHSAHPLNKTTFFPGKQSNYLWRGFYRLFSIVLRHLRQIRFPMTRLQFQQHQQPLVRYQSRRPQAAQTCSISNLYEQGFVNTKITLFPNFLAYYSTVCFYHRTITSSYLLYAYLTVR